MHGEPTGNKIIEKKMTPKSQSQLLTFGLVYECIPFNDSFQFIKIIDYLPAITNATQTTNKHINTVTLAERLKTKHNGTSNELRGVTTTN